MVEFPEIVRRRLNRVAGVKEHPDSGMLTAFVEGTLAKHHRDSVLDHLSACSECNHLLVLVAPEREAIPDVVTVGERRGWFAWSPLRWAAAGAAAVIVVSTIWIGRIEPRTDVPAATSIAMQKAPAVTAQLPTTSSVPEQRITAPPRANASRELRRPRELAMAAPHTELPSQPPQFNPEIAAQSRPAAPVDSQSAFQTSAISGVNGPRDLTVVPPEPLTVVPNPEPAPASKPNVPVAPVKALGPVWAISGGALQQSNDSGQTWAVVTVPTRNPLRAVSVLGQEIWVGGDRGTLYHSYDGGQSWTAVVPSSNGEALSADILRIAFSDPRHGWIATAKGDVWTTRDSGVTWQQQ